MNDLLSYHKKNEMKIKNSDVVKENDEIILTHVGTKKNLHSHNHQSEITHQQEVSCFGNNGKGDNGDIWIVESESKKGWKLDEFVRLKHRETGKWLNCNPSSKYGGPVSGHSEITAIPSKPENTKWKAAEGFYFPAN